MAESVKCQSHKHEVHNSCNNDGQSSCLQSQHWGRGLGWGAETRDLWDILSATLAKLSSSDFSKNREKLRQSSEPVVKLGPSLTSAQVHHTHIHVNFFGGQITCLMCTRMWVESTALKRLFLQSYLQIFMKLLQCSYLPVFTDLIYIYLRDIRE